MNGHGTDWVEREEQLGEALADWLEAVERGAVPEEAEYLRRYPAIADELAGCLADWRRFPRPGGPPPSLPAYEQLGDYRILREAGRGGMGVVYEAEEIRLRRRVALKVLPIAASMDSRQLARFHNEARAAASLEHPHIVPVYGVGCEHGVHYYAMKFIEGQSLAQLITGQPLPGSMDATTPFPRGHPGADTRPQGADLTGADSRSASFFHRAAEWGAQAAEALDHAHRLGIIHRDIKPANLLLDAQGNLWVADFGLARTAADSPLTMTGDVLGTLRYMSPEQALGRPGQVGPRTDVYSLGVTLYELLTGVAAFGGRDRAQVLHNVAFGEPVPPRALVRELPVDLETVVLKAMAKHPGDRYPTARELADDLRRFREGRPTRARPPGPLRKAALLVRRHPLAAVVLSCSLVVAALLIRLMYTDLQHRHDLDLAAQAAEMQRFHALLERVRQRRGERPDGWADDNLADLRQLAAAPPAKDYQADLCSEAAAALAAPRLRRVRELAPGTNAYACAFSPDGETVALGERYPAVEGQLRVWLARVATGKVERVLLFPVDTAWEKERAKGKRSDGARAVAFSPDGEWLVVGTRGGRLVRWRWKARAPRPVIRTAHTNTLPEDHTGDEVRSLQFSEDGSVLLSGALGGAVCRWNVCNGWEEVPPLQGHLPIGGPLPMKWPVIHRTDKWVFQPLDLTQQRFPSAPPPHNANLAPFAISRSGQIAATTSGQLCLLGANAPHYRRPVLGLSSSWERPAYRDLSFSGDGRWLLATQKDRPMADLWDTVGAAHVARARLGGGSGRIAPSPDGRYFAVCDEGRAQLFEVALGPTKLVAACLPQPVSSFALSDGGLDLATLSDVGGPRIAAAGPLWRYSTVTVSRRTPRGRQVQELLRVVNASQYAMPGLAWGRGGSPPELAIITRDHSQAHRIVFRQGGVVKTTHSVRAIGYGHDGALWAIAGSELYRWAGGRVHRVNTVTAEEDRAGIMLTALLVTRHGTFAGRRDGRLYWFDERGRLRGNWSALAGQEITCLAVRDDGAEVLVGGERGDLVRARLPSGTMERLAEPPHRDAVTAVAYLKGGVTLTASADRTIRFWGASNQPLLVLTEGGPIAQAAIDGRELFVLVKGEWGVRSWDLGALHSGLTELGLAPAWAAPAAGPPQPPPARHGLTAELFDDDVHYWLGHRRIDEQVYLAADARPSPSLLVSKYSIRWTGYLRAPQAGRWELQAQPKDGLRAWLDGSPVVFDANGNAVVGLPAGPVPIRVEHVTRQGASCSLRWRRAGTGGAFEPVPPSALFPDRAAAFSQGTPR